MPHCNRISKWNTAEGQEYTLETETNWHLRRTEKKKKKKKGVGTSEHNKTETTTNISEKKPQQWEGIKGKRCFLFCKSNVKEYNRKKGKIKWYSKFKIRPVNEVYQKKYI